MRPLASGEGLLALVRSDAIGSNLKAKALQTISKTLNGQRVLERDRERELERSLRAQTPSEKPLSLSWLLTRSHYKSFVVSDSIGFALLIYGGAGRLENCSCIRVAGSTSDKQINQLVSVHPSVRPSVCV